MHKVLKHLRRAALLDNNQQLTDSHLLECFVTHHDEIGFEILVKRHGSLVMGVCQRVLKNRHDAEDAFQATFLVLAKKAGSLRSRESLSSWLYGVAYRTSLRARAMKARRREKERQAVRPQEQENRSEALDVLDEELHRLPERYRLPVILCDLQGQTRKAAAAVLRIPTGTLSSRLALARKRLAQRLARRGVVLSGAVITILTGQSITATVPPMLIHSTVHAAVRLVSDQVVTGLLSRQVVGLTEAVVRSMFLSRLRHVLVVCGAISMVVAGSGRCLCSALFDEPASPLPIPSTLLTPPAKPRDNWALGTLLQTGHGQMVWSVAFSPDGKTLATASMDGTLKLWDVDTTKEIGVLRGHLPMHCAAYSSDGKLLATGGSEWGERPAGELLVWDVASRQICARLIGHTGAVYAVAFSPDGRNLASCSFDKTVRLWEIATQKERAMFTGHTNLVPSVTFSPNGKLLASASFDRTVRIWDVYSGTETAVLRGHTAGVRAALFTPDGRTVISAGEDKTIKLWDAESWSETATLKGHTEPLLCIALSPDGATLASGSANFERTVRLWDVRSRKEIAPLRGHSQPVSHVAFSPGGDILATVGDWNNVKLWLRDAK